MPGVFVIRRLQDDMQFSAAGEAFKKQYIWRSLMDWKTWVASKFFFLDLWFDAYTTTVGIYMGLWVSHTTVFVGMSYWSQWFSDGPLYAFSLFLPSIINQASKYPQAFTHDLTITQLGKPGDSPFL